MALWKPDPSFYPSARLAGQAPAERLAYVVTFDPQTALGHSKTGKPDSLAVIDVDPSSASRGKIVGRLELGVGNELHHFGWNACSAALCPYAPHPHVERRYFIIPGLRSSRIFIVGHQARPAPSNPGPHHRTRRSGGPHRLQPSAHRALRSRRHLHERSGRAQRRGAGGIFLLDHDSFDVLGRWEVDRGPQYLAYDFWWHLGHDVAITSEWGTPSMVENGVNPDLLLAGGYGHAIHIWDLRKRRHLQTLDLGAEQQMVLELRPSHDPTKTYGFVGVVVSTKDLSASIWTWYRDEKGWQIRKVIEVPAEPTDPALLPPALKPFKAVPPLITDINLSLDDRFLYVSCWGTGEFQQYDVSDPFKPKLTGSVRLGGITSRAPHPKAGPLNGGAQMVELSRDGRRVYLTNSLYSAWDAQFYPEGLRGWLTKIDADPNGGLSIDKDFFVGFEGERPHQVRLEGGDASSDSYCYP